MTLAALVAALVAAVSPSSETYFSLRAGAPNLCGLASAAARDDGATEALAAARSAVKQSLGTIVERLETLGNGPKTVKVIADPEVIVAGLHDVEQKTAGDNAVAVACLDLRQAARSFDSGPGDVQIRGLSKAQNRYLVLNLLA